MQDSYSWVALYSNGETLGEHDGGGQPFAAVDLSRLAAVVLVPNRPGFPQIHVRIGPGMRPIFFRRRSIALDPNSGESSHLPSVTVIGWQKTVAGRNVKSFTWIFDEDGSIALTDQDPG